MSYSLVCRSCKHIFNDDDYYRCPKCSGVLDCHFDLSNKEFYFNVIKNAKSFWDYQPLLPVRSKDVVTIGEGNTSLVNVKNLSKHLGIKSVYVKNEGQNPTGTFKDRCLSVGYTKAKEMNADATVIGSAGNAAAAAAAFAAQANIPCFVMLPANTSMERVVQTLMYGANMIKIRGNVNDCIEMLEKVCNDRGWHNMTTAHPCNPFQAEGSKTIAYELAKDLDWKVPDWIIVPIGGGGTLSSIYKGYCDMYKLGIIESLPKMIGVQEAGCAAVVNAFEINAAPNEICRIENPTGVAVAISDAFPLDGELALKAIYDSNGYAEKVSSEEIATGQSLLGQTSGIFAEPASATTIAAAVNLKNKNIIKSNDVVVCIITGSGLKDSAFAISHSCKPEEVDMDDEQLNEAINRCLQN